MSRNNVRGPTSALTEFLRESGITPTTIARRRATADAANATAPVAGPSNAEQDADSDDEDDGEDAERPSPKKKGKGKRKAPGYGSDDLDEPEEAPKKRKLSKAATEKAKQKAKAKAKKDYEEGEDEEDAYTALSKSTWTRPSAKPVIGNFENCAKCEKQFTVTKYTMAANPGPGFLCHACAKASGTDPFKKPALPKKRKVDKRTIVNFEVRRFPTLASLCIQLITHHINDVEALGDIGALNMDAMAKALSKNRSLNAESAQLFYDIQNTKLTFYDATNLMPPGLCTLASLNPNLTSLRLDLCGRMDDTVISAWSNSLSSLTRLELLGPFLVRAPMWQSFFASHPSLTGFLITQSPRFDMDCMMALHEHCAGLTELRLKEVGKLDDEFVDVLKEMTSLTYLDLSDPTISLSEEAATELMRCIGEGLTHLDLSGHSALTDTFLIDGIQTHVQALTELSLRNVQELTDDGVADFFNRWTEGDVDITNPPFTILDLSRNYNLSSNALTALLTHSGQTLTNLNINGWKTVSEASLREIPVKARNLQLLDVGWCREMDNFVMKSIMEECSKLTEVKVWGCNRLDEHCPRKRNVNVYGVESHTQTK